MSGNKHVDRVAVIVTVFMLVLTGLFMNGAALGIEVSPHALGYETRLFNTEKVHTLDIVMNDWDDFINSAAGEEYSAATVVIDGESYKNVGIRAKGNTSLSTVATLGSERYSFKIEFDHYDKSKSYYGLDKLSLNNLIQDSTMMKDYLTYTLMNEFEVNSSLCSYAYITVNGEDWGLYLAVEGVEEAFLERHYGSDYGELYKPDSMNFGGRGNGKEFTMGNFDWAEKGNGFLSEGAASDENAESAVPDNSMPSAPFFGGEATDRTDASSRPQRPGAQGKENANGIEDGGLGKGSADVKLQYIDDNVDSYSNIWDNAKTDITEADQTRLIRSLKSLSDKDDIASVVDVEQVMRYFVVHNYVCNGDSYTGSMVHNYYLYEKDGKLAMIPWDYNLAFGTFQGGNATDTVNTPIDSPVENGSGEDRPLWNWIVSDDVYTEQYHRYFASFLKDIDTEQIINDTYALIKGYVEKDPTAFYSYEEFETGVETLRQFCSLRSESIAAQLENGETSERQTYADASAITLSDMGSMGGGVGGGRTEAPKASEDSGNPTAEKATAYNTAISAGITLTAGGMGNQPNLSFGDMPNGMTPSDLPNDFDPSALPNGDEGGFAGPMPDNSGETTVPNNGSETENGTEAEPPADNGKQWPNGDFSPAEKEGGSTASDAIAWAWIAVSGAVLAVGLAVAKRYNA